MSDSAAWSRWPNAIERGTDLDQTIDRAKYEHEWYGEDTVCDGDQLATTRDHKKYLERVDHAKTGWKCTSQNRRF